MGTGILFIILSVLAVLLRFASKRVTRAPFGIDDWLLLASLSLFFVTEVLVIRGMPLDSVVRLFDVADQIYLTADIVGKQAKSSEDANYKTYVQVRSFS